MSDSEDDSDLITYQPKHMEALSIPHIRLPLHVQRDMIWASLTFNDALGHELPVDMESRLEMVKQLLVYIVSLFQRRLRLQVNLIPPGGRLPEHGGFPIISISRHEKIFFSMVVTDLGMVKKTLPVVWEDLRRSAYLPRANTLPKIYGLVTDLQTFTLASYDKATNTIATHTRYVPKTSRVLQYLARVAPVMSDIFALLFTTLHALTAEECKGDTEIQVHGTAALEALAPERGVGAFDLVNQYMQKIPVSSDWQALDAFPMEEEDVKAQLMDLLEKYSVC
ncbi:hypothetical protein EXIGLDRAFT_828654 [Exidia glandulosa HHB12029]|uniref:Uncharacterized protein n=1 Tax=Exidia glandulosa HHB12029 TaxID=1314781 RepID=A0A165Q9T2_EXIGL|nr:hypothetical protein EXIGLDRAFT_828654 [Exidia glandulosa HHB12029]